MLLKLSEELITALFALRAGTDYHLYYPKLVGTYVAGLLIQHIVPPLPVVTFYKSVIRVSVSGQMKSCNIAAGVRLVPCICAV